MGARVLKERKKLPIHPTFLLLFLWFVFTKNIASFLLFCVVVLSHELGHYFVAKRLGYALDSFFIAPYGVCLNYKESAFEHKDEILIALAGPLVNFALCIVLIALWWLFPETYGFTMDFATQSFLLGIFNLLPCYPLDGGRVFVGILSRSHPRKWAIKLSIVLNILFASLLFVLFTVSLFLIPNPSLCFCGVFLILGIIDFKHECKYQPIALYKKKTKNFSKPFFYVINGDVSLGQALKKIEVNRFTIFVVKLNGLTKTIDEERVKLFAIKYPLDTTFDEIFK